MNWRGRICKADPDSKRRQLPDKQAEPGLLQWNWIAYWHSRKEPTVNEIVLIIAAIALGIAFITLVGVGSTILMVRLLPGKPAPGLDILRERYARGEITQEQYEHMRRSLAA
jgi:hypothetical protein